MTISRRRFSTGLTAALLAGCGAPGPRSVSADTAYPITANPAYDTWVANFRTRALGSGISAQTFDAAFANAGFTPGVIENDRNQIERTRSFEDYLAIAATPDRVAEGRRQLSQRASLMAEIEARYGVPAQVFSAIWGVESNYGRRMGSIPVISATSTLAFDGRRGAFYSSQLLAALRILQNGDITPAGMLGSWAGAMGHTQFIPTSFESLAVDFRGDGRRDIWSVSDPTDGLASAAAYLDNAGWRRGESWGREVLRSGSGFTDTAGTPITITGRVLQPGGSGTPSFEVFRNYGVILRYNNSERYGIGVGHLSDRIAGAGGLVAGFGPDANGLTLDDRIALQRGLTAAGFDTQGVDGVLGTNSTQAIRAYQAANGLPVTGTPSRALLDRLQ